MKLRRIKISDIGMVITGNTPPRKEKDYYGTEYPFIKPTDIALDTKYTLTPEECYSEKAYKKYKKSLIPKGATCVVTIGSIGRKITMAHTDCFINQAMNAIVPNDYFDEHYVFYLLKQNLFKVKALDSGTSSGRENVSKSAFSNMELDVHDDKSVQQKIAFILSTYDDLIENNLRRITLLEETARFQYIKLMDEGDNIKDELLNIWDINYGKNLPTSKIKKEGKYPVFGASGIIGYYDEANQLGPVTLITSRGNGSGVVHRTEETAFVTNNSFSAVPKVNFDYLHFHLTEQLLRDLNLVQLRSGSAQPQLTLAHLKGVKVCIPKRRATEKYNEYVDVLFDLVFNLKKQNKLLENARDILLPRLMNGEINVTSDFSSNVSLADSAFHDDKIHDKSRLV